MFKVTLFAAGLLITPFLSQAEIIHSTGGELVEKGNESVVYSFDNLSPHDAVFVNFDLYVLDSWDPLCEEASRSGTCNDFFGIEINGEIHKWTFNRTVGAIYYNDQKCV